ncbi:MAG: class I SAM-dependent RNA methyltransferase [Thermoanaerobaculia bacterium]|nr:MAG: class I SAM-dependent RNA methyltransferase [Thermoanaerobaculia bacterium]
MRPPGVPPAGARLAQLDELELVVERLVAGGEGMGRFEGIPIFVPLSAPGDRLRVRLIERKPGYGRAEILAILAPGPGRREPPCPHFAECGGCDLQHLEDTVQLRHKGLAALETLRRLSGVALPPPSEVLAGAAWAYRLRAQVHTRALGSGVQVGYHARGSRRLVPVERCPVLVPELERAVTTLARRLEPPAPPRIDLAAGDDGAIAAAPASGGIEGRELHRRVAGFDYAFDARCFFQGHAGLIEALVERVVGPWEGETAYDLYGGVGLFALPLARRYRRVTLVEGDRIAVRFARKNARLAHAGGVEVVGRAVESWVGGHLPDGAERVVADPPRDGLSPVVRRLLVARAPARLTYVSCHPAALARDLKELAGVFEVESLVLADLFPQTGHVEIVLQLTRRA